MSNNHQDSINWSRLRTHVAATVPVIPPVAGSEEPGLLDFTHHIETLQRIGGGGYGDVFSARLVGILPPSPESGGTSQLPKLAVKVLRSTNLRDEKLVRKRKKQVEREIRVWSSLDHPNILQLLGTAQVTITQHAQPALISIWMPNGTAREFIQNNPTVSKTFIICGVTKGLHYLHSLEPSISHGDLKGVNILIDRNANPLLCDFGLSRLLEDTTLWDSTTTASPKGTMRWLAPEIITGQESNTTIKADVYSYAMTCYELMTDQVPFFNLSRDVQVIFAIVNNQRPERETATNVDGPLWELWTRCWTDKADERPATEEVDAVMSTLFPNTTPWPDQQNPRPTIVHIVVPPSSTKTSFTLGWSYMSWFIKPHDLHARWDFRGDKHAILPSVPASDAVLPSFDDISEAQTEIVCVAAVAIPPGDKNDMLYCLDMLDHQTGYPTTLQKWYLPMHNAIGKYILECVHAAYADVRFLCRDIPFGKYRVIWLLWFFNHAETYNNRGPNLSIPKDYNCLISTSRLDHLRLSAGTPRPQNGFLMEDLEFQLYPIYERHSSLDVATTLLEPGFVQYVIDQDRHKSLYGNGWVEVFDHDKYVSVGEDGVLGLMITRLGPRDGERRFIGGWCCGGIRLEPVS